MVLYLIHPDPPMWSGLIPTGGSAAGSPRQIGQLGGSRNGPLSHFGSSWTILVHFGLFWHIWGHIWDRLGHLGSFFTSASILSPNRQQISPIRKTTRDKISISSTKEWGGLQAAQCIAWRTDLIGYKTTRLQSMGITDGTGNIFTNYHLFVLHADI